MVIGRSTCSHSNKCLGSMLPGDEHQIAPGVVGWQRGRMKYLKGLSGGVGARLGPTYRCRETVPKHALGSLQDLLKGSIRLDVYVYVHM